MSQAARDYLSKIKSANRLIYRLSNTISTLRSSLTSQNYELKSNGVQSSGSKDTLGDTIAKIIDLEAEIDQHIDELVTLKKNTYRVITKIPDLDQQNILIARYIQEKTWNDIAVEKGCGIRCVYRTHKKALESFMSALDSV